MIVQQAMLCGDEIQSAIVDLGTSQCRFGSAGQDLPRHVFRTEVGILQSETAANGMEKKLIYGDTGLRYLSERLEINAIDPTSNNRWEYLEKLLSHGIEDCMRLQCSSTPLLLSHNTLIGDSQHSVEKTMEICFEGLSSPGLYIGNSSMLSSFCAGRANSLVVDIGASGTSISPIIDGYELKRSSMRLNRGGDTIDKLLYEELMRIYSNGSGSSNGGSSNDNGSNSNVDYTNGFGDMSGFTNNFCNNSNSSSSNIKLWFETDKYNLINQRAQSSMMNIVSDSFRRMHTLDIVRDVKKWMSFIPHRPIPLLNSLPYDTTTTTATTTHTNRYAVIDIYNQIEVSNYRVEELTKRGLLFPPPYELPDGTLIHSSDRVCTVAETVFFPVRYNHHHHHHQSLINSNGSSGSSSFDDTMMMDKMNPLHFNNDVKMNFHATNNGSSGSGSSSGSSNKKRSRGNADSNDSNKLLDKSNNHQQQQQQYDNHTMRSINTDVNNASLSDLIYTSIASTDVDARRELLSNIFIVGGGSLIEGVSQRLMYELNEVIPSYLKIKLVSALPIERQNAAWIGGSILGICGSFQQQWLMKSEYEEMGAYRAKDRFNC